MSRRARQLAHEFGITLDAAKAVLDLRVEHERERDDAPPPWPLFADGCRKVSTGIREDRTFRGGS